MSATPAVRMKRHRTAMTGALVAACAVAVMGLPAVASAAGRASTAPTTCTEARVAPYSACVSSYWVSADEQWLLGAEDEAPGGTLCVYLTQWDGKSFAWQKGSPASCNNEPVVFTGGGFAGRPTVYNATGHWQTVTLLALH